MNRPDIIIFNPDQWRGDVVGHLGNPAVHTPVLDDLVDKDAVSFRHAFVQATVCTPSRCSFMTGWYPHVRGHRTMHHMLNPNFDEPNLLKVLRDNGYFVWWGGKNDMVPGQLGYGDHCDQKFRPTRADYERWGVEPSEGSHGGNLAWRGDPQGDNFFSFYKGKLSREDGGKYFDGDWAMVYGAIDFLRSYDGDQPLCLFLPIGYPHPPYCVEEPWFSITDRDAIPRRHEYTRWDDKPSLLKGIRDGQRLTKWSESRWQELRGTYYGMCSRVDHQFGLVLDALKQANRYDEAAVFLFSDHGDFTGDYGLVEKTQNTFQDCLANVPFIVKPPAKVQAVQGVRDQLVELVDFAATVYDLANIECGYWHFGQSLVPLFRDPKMAHRDVVFTEGGRLRGESQASERESMAANTSLGLYAPRVSLQVEEADRLKHTKATMCRTRNFKYVRRAYELDEFYDLRNDPGETCNEIVNPNYAEALREHQDLMLQWYMQTCDVVPMQTDQRNFSHA
ncbi:MAG: sulfatase-like hydrolase/transferase [Gammaproteobacteria bacterium]|nr:sulfatase-like hydrolase/transferase [Gammaproteobacteria bacterium]